MGGEKVKQNYGASKYQYTIKLNILKNFIFWLYRSVPIVQKVNNGRNPIMHI